MKIATAAAMKRAIAIPGIQIRVIAHWQPQLVGLVRTPCRIQTNGYYFMGPQAQDNKIVEMWAPTPKASELRFNEDGTVTFHPDTNRSWTLSFEEQEAV